MMLIPGLPDDISSSLILSLIPYSHHTPLKKVSKLWQSFFNPSTIIPFRANHLKPTDLSHLLCLFPDDPSVTSPLLFDPVTLGWCSIPPMPCNPDFYSLCNFVSVSVGSCLYVVGGAAFDTRHFSPLDEPSASSDVFRFSFETFKWEAVSCMVWPRGSFACGVGCDSGRIVVAGGGSRHTWFEAGGSRISAVEMYDVKRDKWVVMEGLTKCRAGCVGFMVGEDEFWVMGGYGDLSPVDEYYRDAVVLEMKKDGGVGKWRGVGDMWEEGERRRLGRVAVIDDVKGGVPSVFMLDKSDIFRYDMGSNRWKKETSIPKIPKKLTDESSVGFVALNEELHVIIVQGRDSTDDRKTRKQKRLGSLFLQIYHPQKMTWRSLITKPPIQQPLDFKTTVMCTIRL